MQPHRAHRKRMEAAPICPIGKGIYREATDAELDAAYNAQFPEGPKPIATFDLNKREDVERARSVLSPEAITKFFGPDGGGTDAFEASLRGVVNG